MSMTLALDLGTKCGFCVGANPENTTSGVFELKHDRFSGGGMRFVLFRAKLNEMRSAFPISLVVFEEVRGHRGTDAAHVYGGLLALLTEWCENNDIPYQGVPVQTIKKHWTGKGNASKKEMMDVCFEKEICVVDDNEADAVALFDYAMQEIVKDEDSDEALAVPANGVEILSDEEVSEQ